MPESPEHQYLSKSLDTALGRYSETRFLGVTESQRRTFDYGATLLRDFSRPLISQVLWSHDEGIEKDIRTLLHDGGASLKLYFVRDKIRNRARIEEIIRSYKETPQTAELLRGLRLIPIPPDFDADKPDQQEFIDNFLYERIASDLLFAVIFGKLTPYDVKTFSDHGGPVGLKVATLHWIDKEGYHHGPTFQERVGQKGSPLREVIAMLVGTQLVHSIPRSVQKLPSLKGRFMLDFLRRTMFEWLQYREWSPEMIAIFNHLKIMPPKIGEELGILSRNTVIELLYSSFYANRQFGVDILEDIDLENPKFFSEFDWRYFTSDKFMDSGTAFWDDIEDIPHFRN